MSPGRADPGWATILTGPRLAGLIARSGLVGFGLGVLTAYWLLECR